MREEERERRSAGHSVQESHPAGRPHTHTHKPLSATTHLSDWAESCPFASTSLAPTSLSTLSEVAESLMKQRLRVELPEPMTTSLRTVSEHCLPAGGSARSASPEAWRSWRTAVEVWASRW